MVTVWKQVEKDIADAIQKAADQSGYTDLHSILAYVSGSTLAKYPEVSNVLYSLVRNSNRDR